MKDSYTLPAAADMHVHLRDGPMSATIIPTIRPGGANTVYVMPNLIPPLTSLAAVQAYQSRLQAIDPSITYLMTLYLHPTVTPAVIREAAAAGIIGVKSYPAGVTTNSASGVLDYEEFYPVFEEMEKVGMVLNLHGECPSTTEGKDAVTIMNAEASFLPTLKSIHKRFPGLKIVLEHCTSAAAVEVVKECGDSVVATLTAHHLFLVVDDWAGDVFNFCKPVAKLPNDRRALLTALVTSKGQFFLGTDSAPHDISAKKGPGKTAAGVFTQPYACAYVMTALEEAVERGDIKDEDVTQELLEGFFGGFGRKFYGIEDKTGEKIVLKKGTEVVKESVEGNGVKVVPFRAGKAIWTCEWL